MSGFAASGQGLMQNREAEKCSELVWARLTSLPDDTIPYMRAAIENFQRGVWFEEFGGDQRV